MKLRTQLILAFLLLAVVPLGAITLYSYHSSARALRRTVEAESSRMAREMNDRMGVVTANLSRRIDLLETLPFPEAKGKPAAHGEPPDPVLVGRVIAALGDAADYIDAFEFTPAAPAPPSPPQPGEEGAPPSVVVPLPRVAGRIARNPRLQPVIQMAAALLPPEEVERIQKELVDNLGEQGGGILQAVKDKMRLEIEAARDKAAQAQAAHAQAAQAQATHEKAAQARDAHGKTAEAALSGKGAGWGQGAVLALKQVFGCPLKRNGQTVGHLKAKVSADRLLHEVLSQANRDQGEIPFALDSAGNLFTPDPRDVPALRGLERAATSGRADAVSDGVVPARNLGAEAPGESPHAGDQHAGDQKVRIGVKPDENWVVVTREDPTTGLVFGIARPVGAALGEIRRASARNLGAGLALAALALFGIVPISRRMTHNLSDLTHAAGELAAGRLDTQVPVRSGDELGQLAQAFNRMARELAANQKRLVEQERLRKELELCRRIQTELLPKKPLSCSFAQVQGLSIPAHELGGDFYNYFDLPGGEVALFVGDVSGKGVPAALLMANLQATLRARVPHEPDLAAFARQLDREVEASTPPEVYLTLFLAVLDPARRQLRYVNAGHESGFLLRRSGTSERLASTGRPIGLMTGGEFAERAIALEAGDRLLLYTDGLTDAENAAGAEFGAGRLETLLAREGAPGPADLLARVERAYQDHLGGMNAADDATLLVLRVEGWSAFRPATILRAAPVVLRGPDRPATV